MRFFLLLLSLTPDSSSNSPRTGPRTTQPNFHLSVAATRTPPPAAAQLLQPSRHLRHHPTATVPRGGGGGSSKERHPPAAARPPLALRGGGGVGGLLPPQEGPGSPSRGEVTPGDACLPPGGAAVPRRAAPRTCARRGPLRGHPHPRRRAGDADTRGGGFGEGGPVCGWSPPPFTHPGTLRLPSSGRPLSPVFSPPYFFLTIH